MEQLTEEQIDKALEEMGFERREHNIPWYRALKCRIMGPHDWIPIHAYDVETLDVYEDGQICDTCGKEVS